MIPPIPERILAPWFVLPFPRVRVELPRPDERLAVSGFPPPLPYASAPKARAARSEAAIKRHEYFICVVIAYFDFFRVIQPARTDAFKGLERERERGAGEGERERRARVRTLYIVYVDAGTSPFFHSSIESNVFLFFSSAPCFETPFAVIPRAARAHCRVD